MKSRATVSVIILLLFLAVPFSSCIMTRPRPVSEPGLRVAVLPFDGEAVSPPVLHTVRIAFHNHFASTPYDVINPFEADRRLAASELSWRDVQPERLAEILAADAVVEGTVKALTRETEGLRTKVILTLAVTMRDLRTGLELWTLERKVKSRSHVPQNPDEAAEELLGRVFGRPGRALAQAADEVSRKLVAKLPVSAEDVPLRIDSLTVSPSPCIVAPGSKLDIALRTKRNQDIAVSLATGRKPVKLDEVRPGTYQASLPITEDDEAPATAVAISLAGERPATIIDTIHVFAVDATPPSVPAEVKLATLRGGVRLQWPSDPEVLTYRIERRVGHQPFRNIGETNNSWFVDKGAKPSASNEYRVIAVDAAGNSSEASQPVAVQLSSAGPTTLPLRITADVTLPAFGSPYLLPGDVRIAEGATLTLEPGTALHGLGHKLDVRGTLLAKGTRGERITFSGGAGQVVLGSWEGIALDGAGSNKTVLKHCVVEGARCGVGCTAASPTISECDFRRNITAVECVAGSAASVTNCRFSDNFLRAVTVRLAAPTVRGNNFGSEERLSIDERNDPVALDGNWWNSLEPSSIRRRITGPHQLTNCLDMPGGRAVRMDILKLFEEAVMAPLLPTKVRLLLAATDAEPVFVRGFIELAYLYDGAGRTDQALLVLKRCVEKNPGKARAWFHYAQMAARRRDNETAREAFARAAELGPDLPAAHYGAGAIAANEGRLDEAAKYVGRYIALMPNSYKALRVYGEVLARQGRLVEACGPLRRSAELTPSYATGQLSRAQVQQALVLLELGRASKSVSILAGATGLRPKAAFLRTLYGAALIRSGDTSAGLQQWSEAVRLQPSADNSRHLGRIVKRYK